MSQAYFDPAAKSGEKTPLSITDESAHTHRIVFLIGLFFKKSREKSLLWLYHRLFVSENKHFQYILGPAWSCLRFLLFSKMLVRFFDTINRGNDSSEEQTGYEGVYLLDGSLVNLFVFIGHGGRGLSF